MRAIRVAALCLLLAACNGQPPAAITHLAQFTDADLAEASALATAAQEPAGMQCWPFLASLGVPEVVGAATALELVLIARSPATVAKCGPIAVELLVR